MNSKTDDPSGNLESDANEPRSGACASSAACGCSPSISRRAFLQHSGWGAVALSAGAASAAVAGPFAPADSVDHFVPADKKLRPQWVEQLFAKGGRTWYAGDDLHTIGMPVGGVCAGQVYLTGDGRLVFCDIFNQFVNSGWGQINYKVGRLPTEMVNRRDFFSAPQIQQGFALRVETNAGSTSRSLDRKGFPDVRFCGEYPLANVVYRDADCPIDVQLTAYSPFIPLNADDSTLPATVFEFSLKNTSAASAKATLTGWLQNAAGYYSAEQFLGAAVRTNRITHGNLTTRLTCGLKAVEQPQDADAREPIILADFEGGDYGDWRVEGDAFGTGPARGTLERQQEVSGFRGTGLVNTYLGGDDRKHGKLVSPDFPIQRRYISFLVGGGNYKDKTCINLVVDGEVVRTAMGTQNERLRARNWSVRDLAGKKARIEIVDAESGPWGHINIDQIEQRDQPMGDDVTDLRLRPDFGTMCLATLRGTAEWATAGVPDGNAPEHVLAKTRGASETAEQPLDQPLTGALARRVTIEPGGEATIRFVVTWCMPNLYNRGKRVGNQYATRFPTAADVANYVADNFTRLDLRTRLWHETFYDSTLPHWLLDRLFSTVANLATTTCQWWENGRFWAWEGCGCCHGTCGHVWNYEHALARLFPQLERSTREMQDFAPGVGMVAETGEIRFRGEGWGIWAGDSQGGYVLKAYREHQMSADSEFLKRHWPHIRKAVEFLIGQDGNDDGVIEGRQHNTYDIDYYGPNTMVGSLYLGALRAAEEMANEIGDDDFAQRCQTIFQAGSRHTMDRLFNGEYFVQEVDLEKHPKHQYGDGCLADQLFGQGWAHQVGLGYLYPRESVAKTLASVWKYCWTPDVNLQNQAHQPERWFAFPGEAGLLTCTWPKSKHLGPNSTRYRNEVWTGIEYQVAGNMAWEGMVLEALAMCRAVHERYHPAKHNPFNEIECGDHYARALASWGVLIGLAGFEYHGPRAHIGFAPRITPADFRCAFTAAEGWGTLAQQRKPQQQQNVIAVRSGALRVKTLAFELPAGTTLEQLSVTAAGQVIQTTSKQDGARITVQLDEESMLKTNETLTATLDFAAV
jgi:uncharacterized protein (DUF608 family)